MKITKAIRNQIREKYGGMCAYCGCELNSKWEVDHLLPLLRNHDGTCKYPERHTFENFMPACIPCNRDKKTFTIEGWRSYLYNKIEVLRRDSSTYRMSIKFNLIEETNNDITFYFERIQEDE